MKTFSGLFLCLMLFQSVKMAIEPAKIKEKLDQLFEVIDESKDDRLDENELTKWIDHIYRQSDIKSAKKKSQLLDLDNDGLVSLDEYLSDSFGYSRVEIGDLKRDNATESQQILEAIDSEREKFAMADEDGDGFLNLTEFAAFNSPFHYTQMVPYVVSEILLYQDFNGDGVLTEEEYIAGSDNAELMRIEREKFASMDRDHNGLIDKDELTEHYREEAEEFPRTEAAHLIRVSDLNSDELLTRAEIGNEYESWMESAATEMGELLNEESMNQLVNHHLSDEL